MPIPRSFGIIILVIVFFASCGVFAQTADSSPDFPVTEEIAAPGKTAPAPSEEIGTRSLEEPTPAQPADQQTEVKQVTEEDAGEESEAPDVEETESEDLESETSKSPASSSTSTTGTTVNPLSTLKSVAAPLSKPKPESDSSADSKPAVKIPVTQTIETQLSGYTSFDADQLYARLSFREKKGNQEWYIRASHNRTATKYATTKTHVITQRMDGRWETMNDRNEYRVLTGIASRRDRKRGGSLTQRTGYHLMSYGIGKHLDARTKADVGLGLLDMHDDDNGITPIFIASLRGRRTLSDKLTLNADILGTQSLSSSSSTKLDSDLSLSYALSQDLSLRLTWAVNNLTRSIRRPTTREWDSVIRLSITFRKTVKK